MRAGEDDRIATIRLLKQKVLRHRGSSLERQRLRPGGRPLGGTSARAADSSTLRAVPNVTRRIVKRLRMKKRRKRGPVLSLLARARVPNGTFFDQSGGSHSVLGTSAKAQGACGLVNPTPFCFPALALGRRCGVVGNQPDCLAEQLAGDQERSSAEAPITGLEAGLHNRLHTAFISLTVFLGAQGLGAQINGSSAAAVSRTRCEAH